MVSGFALLLTLTTPDGGEVVSRNVEPAEALALGANGPCLDALTMLDLEAEDPSLLSKGKAELFRKHGLTLAPEKVRTRFFNPRVEGRYSWPLAGLKSYGDTEVLIGIDLKGQCAVAVHESASPSDDAMKQALETKGWKNNVVVYDAGNGPPKGASLSKRLSEDVLIMAIAKRIDSTIRPQYRITLGINGVTH